MVFASRVMILALMALLNVPAFAEAAKGEESKSVVADPVPPPPKGLVNPFFKAAAEAKTQKPPVPQAPPAATTAPGTLLQAIQAAQTGKPSVTAPAPAAQAKPGSAPESATPAATATVGSVPEPAAVPATMSPNPPLNKDVKLRRPELSDVAMAGTLLKFDNADIYEVLQAVLGDMLHLNFIVDPSIQGKVTINSQGAVSQADVFNILESILSLNNLSLLRDGKLYKVVKDANAPRDTLTFEALGEGSPLIQIIPVKFVQATALVNTLKNFIGPQAGITNDPTNKYLVVADRASNVSKILDLVKALDVDYLKHVNIKLIQIEKGDALEMAKEMETLFKSSGMFNLPGTEPNKIFFMPIMRMNSLLVASGNEAVLGAAEKWIKVLDDEPKDGIGSNIHVHNIENSNAVHVANILRQIYGGAPITPTGSAASKTIIKGSMPTATAGAVGATGPGLSGSVQIIPDEASNILVIKASPQDYLQIKKVIDRIDLIPRQVLIQVMVAEVTLTKSTQFGIEWWMKNNNRHINGIPMTEQAALGSGLVSPGAIKLGDPKGLPSGFNYMLFNGVGDVVGLMNALSTSGDVNVLSAPHVMASDGKEAKIEVGADMPIVTATTSVPGTTTTSTSISNSVQYRPTGIILSVKPHVNASGLVSLNISQEVSDLGANVSAGGQTYPQFTKRKVETEVTIEGGKTLMIAGLIKDNTDNSSNGIPGLKDIPGLGYLFGAKSDKINKTELMITITPYVVRNREEGDKVTTAFQDSLLGIKNLMTKPDKFDPSRKPAQVEPQAKADAPLL